MSGLPTCDRTDFHLPHRYDEQWIGVRLVAWKCCNGVRREAAEPAGVEERAPQR